MDKASSRVIPGDTPLAEGVESTTSDLPLERTTMTAGVLLMSGWRRISTLAWRWVMSKQATFMAALKWGESEDWTGRRI